MIAAIRGLTAQPLTTSLTTLAPNSLQSDADLVEGVLSAMRSSTSGAWIVDRLRAVGARINVTSDEEFTALGHAGSHAFYDPRLGAMFLRRSDLQEPMRRGIAAVAIAHEGTHLLDDVGQVTATMLRAHVPDALELMLVRETRAFTVAGQVARELSVQVDPADPTAVAVSGANDQTTYDRVWQRLLQSEYNPTGRSVAVRYV